MASLTGLDTNILFYSVDNGDTRKHSISVEIVENLLKSPNNYKVSIQVMGELIRSVSAKRSDLLDLAVQLSKRLLKSREIIVSYSSNEMALALTNPGKHVFDHLIAYTYALNGCNIILTENVNHMPKLEGIEYKNPFE